MRSGCAAPRRRLRAEGLTLEGGEVRTLDRHWGSNSSVESKRVDEFANMSDEELRQYVYGKKALDG